MHDHRQQRFHPKRVFAAAAALIALAATIAIGEDSSSQAAPPAIGGSPATTNPALTGNLAGNTSVDLPMADYASLRRFIDMSPDRLDQLIKTLEYIKKMSPAEREMMRRNIEARSTAINNLREAIRPDMRQISLRDYDVLNRYAVTMLYPAQVQVIVDNLNKAGAPDKRVEIIHGLVVAAISVGIAPNTTLSDKPLPGGFRNGPSRGDNNRGGAAARDSQRPGVQSDHKDTPAVPAGN